MKKITKILAAALLPAMIFSVCACSGDSGASSASQNSSVQQNSAKKPSEITSEIMGKIEFPSMAEISSDRLAGYYDISADAIEEFSAYICGSGAFPDELAVFKMKSSEDVSAAKTVLEKRVESQTKTFENYTPDEMYKIDGNNVIVSGNYIALIICADNSAAIDAFNSMSK